jgi:hypothetical protein
MVCMLARTVQSGSRSSIQHFETQREAHSLRAEACVYTHVRSNEAASRQFSPRYDSPFFGNRGNRQFLAQIKAFGEIAQPVGQHSQHHPPPGSALPLLPLAASWPDP